MRRGAEVYFIHGDHLGSTSLTTDANGAKVAESRYLPYGEERWSAGAGVTDFGFTSQRAERGFGLMDYNARYYSPLLGRFISPDSIVPDPTSSSGFNRYRYTRNNPLRYVDPSGHCTPETCPWSLTQDLVDEYATSVEMERYNLGAKTLAALKDYDPTMSEMYLTPEDISNVEQGLNNDMHNVAMKEGLYGDELYWDNVLYEGAMAGAVTIGAMNSGGDNSGLGIRYAPDKGGGGRGITRNTVNKNTDTYVDHFGVYKIEVDGKLWKYGKADMTNVSNRTGEVVRLRTSINEAKDANPGAKVRGRIIYQNKNISTKDIKAMETAFVQKYYDKYGEPPPGNENHPGLIER